MRIISLILMLFLPVYQSFAQAKKEPVIGFALSGGGAKGLAHIGALKALEDAGIYPDVITGTSMGSIVGGLYAAGYTPEQLIKLSSQLNWEDYFNDILDRTYLTIEEKIQSDRYQIQFPIVDGKVQLPTGLVKGEKISLLLSRLTIPVHGKRDFDNFSPKYRAVATDLETGEAVVLGSGHLSDAIRASMSIPTVFQPIELDGRLLVDGLLIRNLPVQEAFDLGADIVIAIDVGGELYEKDEVSSVFKVLEQTSSFLGELSNEQQRSLASVVISPDISGYSALTFENIDTLIQRGRTAVDEKLPEMEYLLKGYQRKKSRPNFEKEIDVFRDSFLIQGVDYDVESKESEELLRSLFNLRIPNIISLDKLEKKLKTVYSSRFFKKLDYRLLPAEEEGYILSLRAEEQSGNFLKLSANYDSDYGGGILMNATFRNQLIRRSKLSLDLRVSEKPSILGEYLIYTPTRPNFGIRLTGKFNLFYGEFYNDSELINEFGWRHGLAEASIFTAITSRLSFSAGYGMDVLSQNNKFYDPSSDEIQLKQQYGFFAINRDTRDRVHFPTKGSLVGLHVKGILGGTLRQKNIIEEESDLDFSYRLQLQAGHSFKITPKFILQWNNYFGYQDYKDNTNVINLFYIGRDLPYERHHVPFYGLRYMERPADKFAISAVTFQIEPIPNRFLAAHFNYGYIHAPKYEYFNGERVTVEAKEDFVGGVALDLGLLTPIGPGWFSSQYNIDENRFNFLLHLGYIF